MYAIFDIIELYDFSYITSQLCSRELRPAYQSEIPIYIPAASARRKKFSPTG